MDTTRDAVRGEKPTTERGERPVGRSAVKSRVVDGVRVDRTVVDDGQTTRLQYRLHSGAAEPLGFSLSEATEDAAGAAVEGGSEIEGTISPGETLVIDVPSTDENGFGVPETTEWRFTTHSLPVAADGGQRLEDTARESLPDAGQVARPAVGLVATADDGTPVSRAVARAVEGGLAVYVAHDGTADPELLAFVEQLGGTLVPVDSLETEPLREAMVEAARRDDRPGILLRSVGTGTPGFESVGSVTFEDLRDTGPETAPVPEGWTVGTTVVGIPAYNEAATIEGVVHAASAFADVVLVVDDGSRDGTAELAERAGAHVIRHGTNRGYGAALQSVFAAAAGLDAQNLAIVDADGQHDPSEMRSLLDCQRETGADLVIGSRFVVDAETDIPRYRRLGVEIVNVLTNAAIGRLTSGYIHDTQSGFRVYGHRAIESLAADTSIGAGMNASTDIVFHAARHDYEIVEAPIRVRYDVENANTHNPVLHGLHLVANILGHVVRERPVVWLGVPGSLLMLFGVLVWFWASIAVLGSMGTAALALSVAMLCGGAAGTVAGFALRFTHGRHV